MQKIKILFFGSSKFSLPSLEALATNENIELIGVITNPPKKQGRGMILQDNIVYQEALKYLDKSKIFTPISLKNTSSLLEELKILNIDFCVLVSYGKIITNDFLNLPKIDFINIHPSSLPKWRGATPIERTIESGDLNLDICAIRLVEKLDAGHIFKKVNFKYDINDHADDIIPKVSFLSGQLLIETILDIKNNSLVPEEQDINQEFFYAKKISKEELLLNFEDDVEVNFNKIKAFNLYGGCYFFDENQKRIKILKASYTREENQNKRGLLKFNLYVKNGIIKIITYQKEGERVKEC